MNIEEVHEYCLTFKGVIECFPFDNTTLVFKVGNKIFALLNLDGRNTMNLKCEPEKAIELREKNTGIIPGFHMNKKHWNTIFIEEISSKLLSELIAHSYELVVNSLSRKEKEILV